MYRLYIMSWLILAQESDPILHFFLMIRISVLLLYLIADKLLIIKVATENPFPPAFLSSIIVGIVVAKQLDCFHITQRRKKQRMTKHKFIKTFSLLKKWITS